MQNKGIIKRLETTADIFERCTEIYDDILYLKDINDSEKEIIENSSFLNRQIDLEWRIIIVDLKKIFKKSEHYSILKILNFLLSNYKIIKWQNKITQEELRQYCFELENNEILEARLALKGIRNRVVAHLDKNRHKYDDKIKITQIVTLMTFGKKVINRIYSSLTGTEFMFNHLKFSGIETIVNTISELQENNKKNNA
jgi:hypothetical protein